MRLRKFSVLLVLVWLASLSRLLAADSAADANAKFLAGLRAGDPALHTPALEHAWADHAAQFDKAWAQLEQRQLARIREWAPEFLPESYSSDEPMFYMFSGPDFLYANAFFPTASTYILCGTEPVGALPDVEKIPPQVLPSALANLRKSMESVLSWSFFITKNMKTDLNQTQLNGTLPVLYVFLARAGYDIDLVELVALDRAGNFTASGKGTTPGVKIDFSSRDGHRQRLYYFSSDLSDSGITANPGFMKFCEQQGHGLTLLKAASYLMHTHNFDRVRDFLLTHSSVILQDDSGIPFQFFDAKQWTLRFCGRYVGPIEVFKEYPQPDLAKSFAISAPAPLPFGFGYQWQPSRSSLLIAKPKIARAQPVEPAPEPEQDDDGDDVQ